MIADPVFYAAAVPAVILMGLAKGGFSGIGLLSLPLMALVVSPVQAAAITLPILLVQDAVSVWAYRKQWDGRNVVILACGAVFGILAGYLLAAQVSDAVVRLAIGLISVAFAIQRLALGARAKITGAAVAPGLFWGAVSGFTSFVAHAGGPPFQVYVMPQKMHRELFAGTGAVFFAIINLIKAPPYFALGQFTRENLTTAAVLFPVAIVSTWAGVVLVRRVSGERFYTIVYLLLIGVGGKLIVDGLLPLVRA